MFDTDGILDFFRKKNQQTTKKTKKQAGPSQGGYSGKFIHMYARVIFLGFKILNFNIFLGFSEKSIFFGGMKILLIFCKDYHKF